ncbi:MAG: hypothetical protein PHV82_08970 [Victivallaceae bacterium]|nr:hypothetical protein [Victivallaceae bacterium]
MKNTEGIYFSPETAVTENHDRHQEASLNELYRRYFYELKNLIIQDKIKSC